MERPKGKFVFCQVGIVTRDMDRTVREFEKLYGLKPRCIVTPRYENTRIRGEQAEIPIKIALYRGDDQVDFEVIEPMRGKTIYDEWIVEKGEGLHHMAFEVEDTEAWIEYYKSKGISVLSRGERPGLTFTYLDTTAHGGVIIELVERFGERTDPA